MGVYLRTIIHIILLIWSKSLYVAALTAYAMDAFCFLTCFWEKSESHPYSCCGGSALFFFVPVSAGPLCFSQEGAGVFCAILQKCNPERENDAFMRKTPGNSPLDR